MNASEKPHEDPAHQAREIERLNRLYAALSHVNQAIVRTSSRDALFARVCEVLVQHGSFRFAWIGQNDAEHNMLVPLAQYGGSDQELLSLRLYTDGRQGRSQSSRAFIDDRPYICNDMLDDSATQPRRELAQHDFRASASFPIHVNDTPWGTLSVYVDEGGFFEDREIALLAEVAADLSFALDNMAQVSARRQLEAVAETERRLLSGLIESMPGMFYLYTEHGRFLRWNENFEAVSGYSAREISELVPLDFFRGSDKELVKQRIGNVLLHGAASVEAEFISKDGHGTPYLFTGKRIQFDGMTCVVGVGVDNTERKRARDALVRSELRYRSTLDNILEGCQLIGFDWRYLYLNGAASIHNRRPNSELLGNRMPEMWPGIEATPVFMMLQRCLLERVALHEETEFVFPDGSSGWFDVRAQPVPEGVFVLSIDISERKQAEHALRVLNESLELKVAQRTEDLAVARERAESADRLKSAFLATMSHELRTPLNSILGFTGIVLKGMAGPLNAEQEKQLGMVQNSARHLLELINDVLDISKIEAGQLTVHCAPFDLSSSTERVLALVRPLADKKGLALRVVASSSVVTVESDRRRVDQILLNLLNNAVKFTDCGEIALSVELTELELSADRARPCVVRIRVADTGIGMTDSDMVELFQPFRQLNTGLERAHEGTGLGLAICRRLATLLGGTISVESVLGKGSTFTLTLPFKPRT
jgi:PAS domain S-box-containing protein